MSVKRFIADTASVYGKVEMKENVNIWFNVAIRGDINTVFIDEGTNVQDGSILHVDTTHPLTIGKYVTIGHACIIHGCTIEDNVIIGMGATILNGAIIGENSIVGANSLVTQNKVFPPGMLIMGSPAKVVRPLTKKEIEGIRQNADMYINTMNDFLENKFIQHK